VTAAGGGGIAVAVDRLDPAAVEALVARIDREQGREVQDRGLLADPTGCRRSRRHACLHGNPTGRVRMQGPGAGDALTGGGARGEGRSSISRTRGGA
jgi:hypothetical protein